MRPPGKGIVPQIWLLEVCEENLEAFTKKSARDCNIMIFSISDKNKNLQFLSIPSNQNLHS